MNFYFEIRIDGVDEHLVAAKNAIRGCDRSVHYERSPRIRLAS